MRRLRRYFFPISTFFFGCIASFGVMAQYYDSQEKSEFYLELIGGVRGAESEADPYARLGQIKRLEHLVSLGPREAALSEIGFARAAAEAEIEALKRADEEAERSRIEDEKRMEADRLALEKARQRTADEAELKRIADEQLRESERLAAEKAQRAAAAEAERKRAEEIVRLEAERKARELKEQELRRRAEAARILDEDRVCLNKSCSSWILR